MALGGMAARLRKRREEEGSAEERAARIRDGANTKQRWLIDETARFIGVLCPRRSGAETERDAPIVSTPMVKSAPPDALRDWRNPATGAVEKIPDGIDPGFDYNPGTTGRSAAFEAMVQAKLARLSPEIRDAAQRARLRMGLPTEDFMGQRPGLGELPPVPVVALTGEEFGAGLGIKELSNRVEALLKEIQQTTGLPNDDTGWLMVMSSADRSKIAAGNKPSLQATAALQALARTAVVVERHVDVVHKNPHVRAVTRLVAPVEIEGQLYRVKLTVLEFEQGPDVRKRLHAFEAVEIESATTLGTLSAQDKTMGTTQPTTSWRAITIADLLRGATREDGTPFTP